LLGVLGGTTTEEPVHCGCG